MKILPVASIIAISFSVSSAQAITISGSNGTIANVETTAPLGNFFGGSLDPSAAVDGDTSSNAGKFVEYEFTPNEAFTFSLSEPLGVDKFLLWNDRAFPNAGILDFTLNFFDVSNSHIESFSGTGLESQGNNQVPQVFSFEAVENVSQIELVIETSQLTPQGITQFREVEFSGFASEPVPFEFETGAGLLALGALIGYRRFRRQRNVEA